MNAAQPPEARPARTESLDGAGWSIREALGDTAEWFVGAPLPEAGNNVGDASAAAAAAPGWVPARVPGAVIDDLFRAGEVPDPRIGRNSRASEWVAERSWVYRRAVDLPDPAPGEDSALEVTVLEFDGVDPGAEVYWDGELIGRVDGLFHSHSLVLAARHRSPGRHRVALRVHPAPASEPQVGRTERVRVHAPRLGYGWDFSPRLRHQGLWRGARMRTGGLLLGDVRFRSELVGDGPIGTRSGSVRVEWAPPQVGAGATPASAAAPLSAAAPQPEATPPPGAVAEVAVSLDGRLVATASGPADAGRLDVTVHSPELWWPSGFGGQPLYTATLTITAPDGASDSRSRTVGFRTAALVANPGAPDDALGYTALVNGRRIPLLGWNWAPADTLYGSIDPHKVEHLLGAAARSGARLIRVWGGGLIESEHFFDTCDRLGLLVWQEFSQSSSGMQSAPSTDAGFVALMRAEAERIVPTRVHHPSLLLWGGGNELDEGGVPLDGERSPVLAALRQVVAERDPGRAWLPTSPTGPEFHNRLDRIRANPHGQHDVHGPWEHQGLEAHYALANAGTSLAHTEFGVEGMTNLRSLEALIPEPERWPADRTNPVYRHLGEWWNNAPQVVELFGGRPTDLASVNRASQLLQATGLQYSVEADRRRSPRCSMILPWQLNESYPNAWCTSALDFHGDPKPVYFAVARAFEKRRATLRVERAVWAGHPVAAAEAWVWAEEAVPPGSTVAVRARGLDGTVYAERAFAAAEVSDPRAVGILECPTDDLPDVFVWEADWSGPSGERIDLEWMLATTTADWGALLDVPPPTLDVHRDGDALVVRTVGPVAALTLRVTDPRPAPAPGRLVADGDPRPLFPGEERRLGLRWLDTDPGSNTDTDTSTDITNTDTNADAGPVRLEVWNLAPRAL